jgi:glycosyltransferase-like protein
VGPLRIALLTYSTRPRGGVVHTLSLAEALAALGHRVDVWAVRRGTDGFFRPVDPAVGLRLVDAPAGADLGERVRTSVAALRAAFDPGRYDVVHAQDCITANAVDRCVRTVHHLDRFTTPELAACHERAIVTPYAHVCVSRAVAAELRAGWGIEAAVIPNGVDFERFAGARRARGGGPRGPYVVSVGGIEPRKGSVELVEAYALLRRRRPDLRLVVVGGETLFDHRAYREEWERRRAALGVPVEVRGVLPHDDVPAIVAGAAAFAFPSVREGFGLAAMEALAARVPLVAWDRPVLREVFGAAARFAGDVAGLAAGLAAAAADVPAPGVPARPPDAAERRRRAAGTALARAHSWRTAAARHINLYARLRAGVPG